ncbi:coenzyme a synthetase [Histoplasma capsulatum G186AR]|uniref:Coenzyme a synthetase n=2 Tax=Ajellomyces capsulatus TaxID=5037 RepID=C0NVY2_AJECG|nr:coenzyme a synthetase [Histoplasma capsulatum G186AR]EEH04671.1 coenzyme a synthetase [Histoplasma capsulatum G186AR]
MLTSRSLISLTHASYRCFLSPAPSFYLSYGCCFQTRLASTLPDLPIFRALHHHDPKSIAIVHSASGRSFTYGSLIGDVLRSQKNLLQCSGALPKNVDLQGSPVAFLAENGYDYVGLDYADIFETSVALLSILACDGIALPLSPSFPSGELRYILDNSQAGLLLATEKYSKKAQELVQMDPEHTILLRILDEIEMGADPVTQLRFQGMLDPRGGMMLYTSGTTNRPKGVFLPQSALSAQTQSLVEAWEYSPDDRLLHLMPLHHIHGVVNAILAPLLAGSSIEFLFPFNPTAVWKRLGAPFIPPSKASSIPTEPNKEKITFLTAVPTIYNRLLSTHKSLPTKIQQATQTAISPINLRLNISGSAALPTPTKTAWTELSHGNVLLERYGMTEVGMALSCGLNFADRVDNSVGWPLPYVECRLFDADANEVIMPGEEIDATGRERVGEIQLRGPTVFKEYWRNEKATREEFTEDEDGGGRWFKTGDVAVRRHVATAGVRREGQEWCRGPLYFIQGRTSVDIIKTGGEKVSALEIERELLTLPQVAEAAVLAVPSRKWGQKVGVVLVLSPDFANTGRGGKTWGIMDMRRALKGKLAAYKIPSEMRTLKDGLPRNAMGKVNKKSLAKLVFADLLES